MAKKPDLFSRIRTRATRTGKQAKFAAVKFGADLSNLVPAPQPLLERLGIKKAFVPAGVRPSVRSTLVTQAMLSKARLEAEEGRALSPAETKRIRGGKRFVAGFLRQKLRLDPRLGDPSLLEHGRKFSTKLGALPSQVFAAGAGEDRGSLRAD